MTLPVLIATLFYNATAVAVTLLLSLVALVSYRLLLHPLARVPGPTFAAVSNTWHALHARDGRMLDLATRLHQTHGHAVRVGPSEVWFDSPEAFRVIYKAGSGFEKADFYLGMALDKPRIDWRLRCHFPDNLDLLAERDMRRYRLQRRLIGPVYHASNLKKFEGVVDAVLQRAILRLHALEGAEVELKEWMHILVVECLGAVVLSWSPGLLADGSDGGSGHHAYLGWRRKSVLGLFPAVVVLRNLSSTLARAFAVAWGVTHKAPENFKPFFIPVQRQITKRLNAMRNAQRPQEHRKDLLADLIQLHEEKPEFSESYLRRMAMTNFGAGHETVTSALTSTLAMLGSHPDVQERVAKEIGPTARLAGDGNPASLQYTQATIKEAQRLYPTIGMSLARSVPEVGLQIHGHYIPPGTTVGCNPVSLHRNADIFGPDPDRFIPERWLGDDAAVKNMERHNLTFGGGARVCPGRQLAEMLLHKLVPGLIREFEVEAVMPHQEEIRYYFMAILTGVKVRFRPRVTSLPDHGRGTTGDERR